MKSMKRALGVLGYTVLLYDTVMHLDMEYCTLSCVSANTELLTLYRIVDCTMEWVASYTYSMQSNPIQWKHPGLLVTSNLTSK